MEERDTCCGCYEHVDADAETYYSCFEVHGDTARNVFGRDWFMCHPCFYRWIHGEMSADNIGFVTRQCRCGIEITYDNIKSVLDAEQFALYDEALVAAELSRDKRVLPCPGVDCPNAFFKPKRTKRLCRRSVCEECDTVFCCQCGELYTPEHQRMKCGPYKKWKLQNDEATRTFEAWRKKEVQAQNVKPCPGCKQDVEKHGGCRVMRCTKCDVGFCWGCLALTGHCTCRW